ncbi:MAG: hypothetical protein ABTQ28_06390 [Thauera sp.]|jgi:uncharacterized membrane protein affecting hemolysin expression
MMRRRSRFSLRRQMLLVLWLPSMLFILGAAFIHVLQSSRALDQALHERGQAMVNFLAPAAEYVVVSGNRDALASLMAQVQDQPDVIGVGFYDAAGSVLAAAGEVLSAQVRSGGLVRAGEIVIEKAPGWLCFDALVLAEPASVDDYAAPRSWVVCAS